MSVGGRGWQRVTFGPDMERRLMEVAGHQEEKEYAQGEGKEI